MFAGIIEAVGTVVGVSAAVRRQDGGGLAHRLEIDLGPLAEGLQHGASVAINGVCLTLAERRGTVGGFDVVPETWRQSTLHALKRGERVNLECSLRVGQPVDGHFVQGHVDGIGPVDRVERTQGEWKLWVRAEPALLPFIIRKGSIALDGTSLTIVDVVGDRFSVVLVPTTLERTILGHRRPGEHVNIETDILARLVVSRLEALAAAPGDGPAHLSWEKLDRGGFLT